MAPRILMPEDIKEPENVDRENGEQNVRRREARRHSAGDRAQDEQVDPTVRRVMGSPVYPDYENVPFQDNDRSPSARSGSRTPLANDDFSSPEYFPDDQPSDDQASDDQASDDQFSDDQPSDDRSSKEGTPHEGSSEERSPREGSLGDRSSEELSSDDRSDRDRLRDIPADYNKGLDEECMDELGRENAMTPAPSDDSDLIDHFDEAVNTIRRGPREEASLSCDEEMNTATSSGQSSTSSESSGSASGVIQPSIDEQGNSVLENGYGSSSSDDHSDPVEAWIERHAPPDAAEKRRTSDPIEKAYAILLDNRSPELQPISPIPPSPPGCHYADDETSNKSVISNRSARSDKSELSGVKKRMRVDSNNSNADTCSRPFERFDTKSPSPDASPPRGSACQRTEYNAVASSSRAEEQGKDHNQDQTMNQGDTGTDKAKLSDSKSVLTLPPLYININQISSNDKPDELPAYKVKRETRVSEDIQPIGHDDSNDGASTPSSRTSTLSQDSNGSRDVEISSSTTSTLELNGPSGSNYGRILAENLNTPGGENANSTVRSNPCDNEESMENNDESHNVSPLKRKRYSGSNEKDDKENVSHKNLYL